MIYDDVLDATWLQDGNTFATQLEADPTLVDKIINTVPVVHDTPNPYDFPSPHSCAYNVGAGDFYGTGGLMDWWGAQAWMGYLNSIDYNGSNQWALPTAGPFCGFTTNCTNSQWGELYYTALSNVAGGGLQHRSPFTNLLSANYWSGTEDAASPDYALGFYTTIGYQYASYQGYGLHAEAVTPGDLAAVPEPGVWALLGLGRGAVLVMRRRRS